MFPMMGGLHLFTLFFRSIISIDARAQLYTYCLNVFHLAHKSLGRVAPVDKAIERGLDNLL